MASKTVTVRCPHCDETFSATVSVPDRNKPAGVVWKSSDEVRITCENSKCRKDFTVTVPM